MAGMFVLAGMLAIGLAPGAALADYRAGDAPEKPVPGETVIHAKFGDNVVYTVESNSDGGVQGEAALGGNRAAAIPVTATGTVVVPKDIYIVYDWEKSCTYEVTSISAHAFDYGDEEPAFDTVLIEGEVALAPDALAGLPATVSFQTYSEKTAQVLVEAGVPSDRVAYQALGTRYVAFGDSIAAGYKLAEYDNSIKTYDGLPTPSNAFVTLTGAYLNQNYGPALADNMAMSGWASYHLLDQLNRGDYNAALADAGVVSVTIGSNDLLGRFIQILGEAIDEAFKEAFNETSIAVGMPELQVSSVSELTDESIEAVESKAVEQGKPGLIPTIINKINDKIKDDAQLNEACVKFKDEYQPAILAKLQELAPSAEIYWTTLYNPFYGAVVDIDELFPEFAQLFPGQDLSINLSDAGAHYIEIMNQAFETNTAGYHRVDLYEVFNQAGVTNVDIRRDKDTGKLFFDVDPHPNARGHAIIADKLEAVIADTYALPVPDPDPVPPVDPAPQPAPADQVPASTPASSKGNLAPTGDALPAAVPLGLMGCVAVAAFALVRSRRA